MNALNTTELANEYFELWDTTDDARRHALARKIFTESAVHHVAPMNVSFTGVDEIEANITRVNTENIQQAGLQFRPGANVPNHDSLMVEWEIADGTGAPLGGGRDLLILDGDGQVTTLYMFRH